MRGLRPGRGRRLACIVRQHDPERAKCHKSAIDRQSNANLSDLRSLVEHTKRGLRGGTMRKLIQISLLFAAGPALASN